MDTRLKTPMNIIRQLSASALAALLLVGCGDSRDEQEAQLRKLGASVDASYNAEKTAQLKLIGEGYHAYCQTNSAGPDGPDALLGALAGLGTEPVAMDDLRTALSEGRYSVVWNIPLNDYTNSAKSQALAWDDNLNAEHAGQVLTGELEVRSVALKTFKNLRKFGGAKRAVLGNGTISQMGLTPTVFPKKKRLPDLSGDVPPPLNLPLDMKLLETIGENSSVEDAVKSLRSDSQIAQATGLSYLSMVTEKEPNDAVCEAAIGVLVSETDSFGLLVMEVIEPWLTDKGLASLEKALNGLTSADFAELQKMGEEIAGRYRATSKSFVSPLVAPTEKK
jgi:hypothetical protein